MIFTHRPALPGHHASTPQKPARLHHLTTRPHPAVWRIIIGLAALLILGVWGFSGGQGYNGLIIAIVSLFVCGTIGISLVLNHIAHRRQAQDGTSGPLRDWLDDEFDIWQGHLPGRDALAGILMPVGAVAIGMVVFAVVLHLTRS